jgi:glycosyltransferase involved in cell wall biosynthesis
MTSDREGFGLPVVEALASGTSVVATDLPVLREVGGAAARYCPLGDIEAWRNEILHCLRAREQPDVLAVWQQTALKQARLFSWNTYAASMLRVYRTLWSGPEWQVELEVVKDASASDSH